MGFPASHQPRSCVTPNFPKIRFRYPNVQFLQKFRQKKALKVCYKVLLSKNFQRQSCSMIIYLSNCINILAGDDSIPIEFGPKGTDHHHVSHAACCAVSDSRPFCSDFLCSVVSVTQLQPCSASPPAPT